MTRDDRPGLTALAGLKVVEVLEREPYEGVEHPSRRAYVLAARPV